MAAALVCRRCKLTRVQQRWQWQRCNTTVHTSVAAMTHWQRCDSGGTDSAVTAVSTDIAVNISVTAMAAALVCRRCKLTRVQQRWQWQRCNTTVHTSVAAMTTDSAVTAVALTALSQRCQLTSLSQRCQLTPLSQRCQCHRCHSAVSCHRCHTSVHGSVTLVWQQCAH